MDTIFHNDGLFGKRNFDQPNGFLSRTLYEFMLSMTEEPAIWASRAKHVSILHRTVGLGQRIGE